MEQFYYEGTAVVENADADCHSLLKASALLRYVEQISTMHERVCIKSDTGEMQTCGKKLY